KVLIGGLVGSLAGSGGQEANGRRQVAVVSAKCPQPIGRARTVYLLISQPHGHVENACGQALLGHLSASRSCPQLSWGAHRIRDAPVVGCPSIDPPHGRVSYGP